jgi:enediyne biosynthesis protein E3
MSVLGAVLRPLFEAAPSNLPAAAVGAGATAERLSRVVSTVTECCQTALVNRREATLVRRLDAYPEELRGFAYEGAGVGLAALDHLLPFKQRTRRFVDGAANAYVFAVYLGAGMGLARLRRNPEPFRRRLRDDVFNWVVLDGYGFHEGFFAHRRHVQERATPRHLSGYGLSAFDHGLGRSIWFATGADVKRVVATIEAFPESRRGDLWAGVGLACGYTGGVDEAAVEALRARADAYRGRLAEGVIVAARARHQVGNAAEHNEIACRVVCGIDSREAADIAATALADLPADGVEPAYEIWRRRIRHRVA